MRLLDRRRFLVHGMRAGGAAFLAPSVSGLLAACAENGTTPSSDAGYGELIPAGPELALPRGFRYVKFGVEGDMMADGVPTPRAHDGMAAFALPNGNMRLIRNHEDRDGPGDATLKGDAASAYDPKGGGGTTSLEIAIAGDGTPTLVRDFVSLNGTIVNCAGGPTPWGTWLSCEETTQGTAQGWEREHGYVFEVGPNPRPAEPLRALGRFVHEAVAVDPATGIVYETEDRNPAGFYRFIPEEPGNLGVGGRLQMLAVTGRPEYDTRTGQGTGSFLHVTWVDIADPNPAGASSNAGAVAAQGFERGAAIFARLEGCWFGDGSVFFHATSGGDDELGQVWQYIPVTGDAGVLRLVFESRDEGVLSGPDNITVSPRGGLLLCEDGRGPQHLRGLTQDGRIFDFARNIVNDGEFAGACFSPDGSVLFVNIQGRTSGAPGAPGMTFAIWGEWGRGGL